MLLVRPIHSTEFLDKHQLGVEAHIGRYDLLPDWDQYIPYVHGVHLPYQDCNLASTDQALRESSITRIKEALTEGSKYPVDRMVIHTAAYQTLGGKEVGEYDKFIESFQTLADLAARKNIILCIENQVKREATVRRVFGSDADEWLRIATDIERDNILLTLDTSHAATSVAIYDSHSKRIEGLFAFLERPELIGRIHWSGARIANNESKFNDMHLIPGGGDLPLDFHRAIKKLPVVKLLEQTCSQEEVCQALDFVEKL
jgi:sugar phosphate isomerase/epimerase